MRLTGPAGPPRLGVGLAHRPALHDDVLRHAEHLDFVEVMSDDYIGVPTVALEQVRALAERLPVVAHGVGLSLGTDRPLDEEYVEGLGRVLATTGAVWFSDHLSFSRTPSSDTEELLPLVRTERAVDVVCGKVAALRERIDRPFLLENITYYFDVPGGRMSEAEFLTTVLERADCGLLLDVNNVYVNAVNHGYDPYAFLDAIPLERVVEVHVAGGVRQGDLVIDSHAAPVWPEVWELLRHVLARTPARAVLLEWDHDFPPFEVLLEHVDRIRAVWSAADRSPAVA